MKETIKFDEPEFYNQGTIVLTASGPHGTYHIVSEGERSAHYHHPSIGIVTCHTAEHFRNNFPDGNLPEMSDDFEWSYNGWFAIYEDGAEDCEPLGEPLMSLAEAVTYTLELANKEQ